MTTRGLQVNDVLLNLATRVYVITGTGLPIEGCHRQGNRHG
jgi:hypothetical protein